MTPAAAIRKTIINEQTYRAYADRIATAFNNRNLKNLKALCNALCTENKGLDLFTIFTTFKTEDEHSHDLLTRAIVRYDTSTPEKKAFYDYCMSCFEGNWSNHCRNLLNPLHYLELARLCKNQNLINSLENKYRQAGLSIDPMACENPLPETDEDPFDFRPPTQKGMALGVVIALALVVVAYSGTTHGDTIKNFFADIAHAISTFMFNTDHETSKKAITTAHVGILSLFTVAGMGVCGAAASAMTKARPQ